MDSRLFWLALAAFVGSTEGGLIVGLLPSIGQDMGVTAGQAGQAVLGYSLAYAIAPPVLSVVLGHVGRRRILSGSEFLLGVTALLIAASPFFLWLVGARTLLAIAAGTFTGTALAVAAQIAAPGQRGRAIQIVSLGQSIAVLVGVPLGAFVAQHFSWRIDYVIVGVMAVAASIALYFGLPKGMLGDVQTMRERIRVLANPGVPTALATTLLFMTGAYPVFIFLGAVVEAAGIGREALPVALLGNGIGAVAAGLSAGRIADRIGGFSAIAIATLISAFAIGGFAVVPLVAPELRLPLVFGLMLVFGYVGWGYWIAHCSEIAGLAPTSVPLVIAMNLTALNVSVAAAAAVGGVIVDTLGANALALASVPFAALAFLLVILSRRKQQLA